MGHGHNNLNDMPSGLRNWGITIAGAVAIGILFLFVGTSWTGPGNHECCGDEQTCEAGAHGEKGACCKGEAKGGHGDAACCKGGAHGDAKACAHTCGEECHKAGKCTHTCTDACKAGAKGDAKACGHVCGEECHKAGKCTHECTAECKAGHAHGGDSAKKPEAAPAGH